MKTFFTLFSIIFVFLSTSVFSQSGTFNFTSDTIDLGATVTHVVDGVTLTISANNGGVIDIVDPATFPLTVTSVPPQAYEMNGMSNMTLSFSQAVNIKSIFCSNGTNQIYYWNFSPVGGVNSPKNNQLVDEDGTTITLDFIGINSINITVNQIGTYVGVDDIIMDASLPVELTSFTGISNGSNVVLNWATATEVNNYGFNVEAYPQPLPKEGASNSSLGGKEGGWKTIGFVNGHGNANSPKRYSFEHQNAPMGKIQYRLKQIDFDGAYEYSNIIELATTAPSAFSLTQNYPNPFNPSTKIEFAIQVESHVKIEIYNVLGELITTITDKAHAPGVYNVEWVAKDVSSGLYFYKITARPVDNSATFTSIRKMILLR